ncbi:MAG: flagellin [Candidatus Rokubacteria bacterium]|nr:flagellin [Candidatus Rokubacteria bacterium]MBI3826350.1 flagellin [Candidatus Rokubacteria bacterium]
MAALGDITRIRTNISALNALNALKGINNRLNTSNLRLATGKRINSAADDPSGFSLAGTLRLRARRLGVAIDNLSDATNVLNTAESGLSGINDILGQMAEKATLAASDTQGSSERSAILTELNQLAQEIDAISQTTQFNGNVLLTAATMTFQVGPTGVDTARFTLASSFTSSSLGINTMTVATQTLASATLGSINAAITSVQTALQSIGALIERFQVKSDNLLQAQVNASAAASRIEDADLATEQLNKSNLSILLQTATAQLAGANSSPISLLQLFKA